MIVSNDHANQAAEQHRRGVLTVVPVTSNVARVYPFQVRLPAGTAGLTVDSKARAEQVRAVAVTSVGELLERLDAPSMEALDEALRLHLAI